MKVLENDKLINNHHKKKTKKKKTFMDYPGNGTHYKESSSVV